MLDETHKITRHLIESAAIGVPNTGDTAVLSVLRILSGIQVSLVFLSYDIASGSVSPFHPNLVKASGCKLEGGV
jgi:hypothetical protein